MIEEIKKESVTLLAVSPIEIQLKYKRVCAKGREEEDGKERGENREEQEGEGLSFLIFLSFSLHLFHFCIARKPSPTYNCNGNQTKKESHTQSRFLWKTRKIKEMKESTRMSTLPPSPSFSFSLSFLYLLIYLVPLSLYFPSFPRLAHVIKQRRKAIGRSRR